MSDVFIISAILSRGAALDSFAAPRLIRPAIQLHGFQPWLGSVAATRLERKSARLQQGDQIANVRQMCRPHAWHQFEENFVECVQSQSDTEQLSTLITSARALLGSWPGQRNEKFEF